VACAIATFGTPAQQARYLQGLATGEEHASLCLSEPGCGSDLQAVRTLASDEGDTYSLTGSKTYVTNGGKATLLLTLARHALCEGEARPKLSLLLVDKASPKVAVTTVFEKTAFGLVDTVQIELDGAAVPKAQLLGGVAGEGFGQLMQALEVGRIAIASSAVGLAADALSQARRYAAERHAFGVSIDKHQAVQLKLADMATKLVAARLLTMEAARLKQLGGRRDMITAMAKTYASDVALEIAHAAVVIHGGAGYIRDYAVERLHREALLYTIGEGTNDINRIVIARRLQGEDEMAYLGLIERNPG
jgi:alkylation response protein AidB-like acyl-CoA dehydrogenase